MGLRGANKPCEWICFSREPLELVEKVARHINRHQITKYAKRNNLLLPKYVRKIAWKLMVKAMSWEATRFIQSRFGELRVGGARYEDLLSGADQQYPAYLRLLREVFGGVVA